MKAHASACECDEWDWGDPSTNKILNLNQGILYPIHPNASEWFQREGDVNHLDSR